MKRFATIILLAASLVTGLADGIIRNGALSAVTLITNSVIVTNSGNSLTSLTNNGLLRYPIPYNVKKRYPVIFYFHAFGEQYTNIDADLLSDGRPNLKKPMVRAAQTNGFFVVAHAGGGNAWGNPNSVAEYRNWISWCYLNLPHNGKFIWWAQSMGGIASHTTVNFHPQIRTAGYYGIFPGTDLHHWWENPSGSPTLSTARGSITNAYQLNPTTGEPWSNTYPYDPLTSPTSRYLGLRWHLVASKGDLISGWGHASRMQEHIAGVCIEASITEVTGTHGSDDSFRLEEFIEFILRVTNSHRSQ